ncbi:MULTISPECIES: putative leader peptide [unclassified Frankia]
MRSQGYRHSSRSMAVLTSLLTSRLTSRRHIDLLRVSSATCSR